MLFIDFKMYIIFYTVEDLTSDAALKPISSEEIKIALEGFRKATSPFRYFYGCAVCGCRCDVEDIKFRCSLAVHKLDALKVAPEDIEVIINFIICSDQTPQMKADVLDKNTIRHQVALKDILAAKFRIIPIDDIITICQSSGESRPKRSEARAQRSTHTRHKKNDFFEG